MASNFGRFGSRAAVRQGHGRSALGCGRAVAAQRIGEECQALILLPRKTPTDRRLTASARQLIVLCVSPGTASPTRRTRTSYWNS